MTTATKSSESALLLVLVGVCASILIAAAFVQSAASVRTFEFGLQQNRSNTNSSTLLHTVYPMLNITAAQLENGVHLLKNGNTSGALSQIQSAHSQLMNLMGSGQANMTRGNSSLMTKMLNTK